MQDFAEIVRWSRHQFGVAQADRYRASLWAVIRELQAGPKPPLSKAREDLGPGLRVLHAARKGRPARHFIVYREVSGDEIEIVRLFHDSMELSRHRIAPG